MYNFNNDCSFSCLYDHGFQRYLLRATDKINSNLLKQQLSMKKSTSKMMDTIQLISDEKNIAKTTTKIFIDKKENNVLIGNRFISAYLSLNWLFILNKGNCVTIVTWLVINFRANIPVSRWLMSQLRKYLSNLTRNIYEHLNCYLRLCIPKLNNDDLRHEKWNKRLEFKSRTRLFAFHFALMTLRKSWFHLFSPRLWVK